MEIIAKKIITALWYGVGMATALNMFYEIKRFITILVTGELPC